MKLPVQIVAERNLLFKVVKLVGMLAEDVLAAVDVFVELVLDYTVALLDLGEGGERVEGFLCCVAKLVVISS